MLVSRIGLRIRNAHYTYDPPGSTAGLLALRSQLGMRGAGAPIDILGPVTALRELEAICAGMVRGHGRPAVVNRDSLRDDLQHSLGALGPLTRAKAGALLNDFQRELDGLKTRLNDAQGARVVLLEARSLLDKLSDEEVCTAAWQDTVETFTDESSEAENCELRIAHLVELAEHRGLDYDRWATLAESLIGDDANSLQALGETVAATNQPSGVAERRRLDLCAEQLAKPPEPVTVVVWLALTQASLPEQSLRLGPMLLIDMRFLGAQFTEEAFRGLFPDDFQIAELDARGLDRIRGMYHATGVQTLAGSEHRVFARITVENTQPSAAITHARMVLTGLIDLAESESGWVLLNGHEAWVNGRDWGNEGFIDPRDELNANRAHPVHDQTPTRLQDFDAALVARWLGGDPGVAESVDDALWRVAVERAPTPSQRIMLGIRGVERVVGHLSAGPDASWAMAASHYLRGPWVRFQLTNDLFDAAVTASNLLPDKGGTNAQLNRSLFELIFGSTRRLWSDFMVELAPLLIQAVSLMPVGSLEHRVVREASASLNTSAGAQLHLSRLGTRFDRLLARSERQRNALMHGTGTTEPVRQGVDRFVVTMTQFASREAMHRAERDYEPFSELEVQRVQALEQDARLRAGVSPLAAVWERG